MNIVTTIKIPAMVVVRDKNVITTAHALELHQQIKNSELAIIPGNHGEYIGEITTITSEFNPNELIVPMLEKFINKK